MMKWIWKGHQFLDFDRLSLHCILFWRVAASKSFRRDTCTGKLPETGYLYITQLEGNCGPLGQEWSTWDEVGRARDQTWLSIGHWSGMAVCHACAGLRSSGYFAQERLLHRLLKLGIDASGCLGVAQMVLKPLKDKAVERTKSTPYGSSVSQGDTFLPGIPKHGWSISSLKPRRNDLTGGSLSWELHLCSATNTLWKPVKWSMV